MKQTKLFLFALALVLALSGCRSSRHARRQADVSEVAPSVTLPSQEDGSTTSQTPASDKSSKKDKKKQTQTSKVQPTQVDALTAKMDLTLEAGEKGVSVGGSYRLKRGEVVQINLTYTMLFTVSVGTLELTPDYILVLDRINKRYCRVAYADVPALRQSGIDFNYLQSIFWGEAEASPAKVVSWTYSNWQNFGKGQFPGEICFTLTPGNTIYKATFSLSNLRENDNWEKQTAISSKYTAVSIDTVLKALLSVAK